MKNWRQFVNLQLFLKFKFCVVKCKIKPSQSCCYLIVFSFRCMTRVRVPVVMKRRRREWNHRPVKSKQNTVVNANEDESETHNKLLLHFILNSQGCNRPLLEHSYKNCKICEILYNRQTSQDEVRGGCKTKLWILQNLLELLKLWKPWNSVKLSDKSKWASRRLQDETTNFT